MTRVAFFLATSGHSGVDRVMTNLITEFAGRGLSVDLLRIAGHGPYLDPVPPGVRRVDLGTAHVNTSLPALVRYLKRERPAALLTDKDRVNRVALWARRLAGVPTRLAVRVGTTVSENLARRGWWDRQVQYLSIRRFYQWADAVIVPSRGAAEDLARIGGWPPGRIQVIPSPVVDDRLVTIAGEGVDHPWLNDPDGPPVILGVGELGPRKDFATLIRAFAIVHRHRPCRLIILGRGRQKEKLVRMADSLEVSESVSFPGFVVNPYAFMARADLFVLSSTCEGAPVVLMEALGLGVPVISTDCPSGPREILQGGRYGPLVPVGDPEALAGEIRRLLSAPTAAEHLKEAAHPFRVSQSADRYLAALGIDPVSLKLDSSRPNPAS
jgi:glycosyltransferase involved in cell wall biosynthesis